MTRAPEAAYSVWLDQDAVHCRRPSGDVQIVSLDKLRAVHVETNDSGPWGIDVWFVLNEAERELEFPLGASGEASVLERLQQLPGFEMKGMNSTANARFLCWSADGQGPAA